MTARNPSPPEVRVHPDPTAASRAVAAAIAAWIREQAERGVPAVLGLATGQSPRGVYAELARLHREEGLSFAGVTTFNLDEYWPIQPEDPGSFHAFLHQELVRPAGLDPARVHLPDGRTAEDALGAHCAEYEKQIAAAGGIGLQLLGIGRNGHIGFNEPGSARASRTRRVELSAATREDAASAFGGLQAVPRHALTMGVGTILEARRIVLLAFGAAKAVALQGALERPPRPGLPASWLQEHPGVEWVADAAAAARLRGTAAP